MIQKPPYFFFAGGHDVLIFIAVNMKLMMRDLDLLKSVIHFETFHGIYIPELCWIYFLNASEHLQNAK